MQGWWFKEDDNNYDKYCLFIQSMFMEEAGSATGWKWNIEHVSFGVRKFGLKKEDIKKIIDTIPNLGFHANLNRLALNEIKNRRNPMPMMRW